MGRVGKGRLRLPPGSKWGICHHLYHCLQSLYSINFARKGT